MTSVLQNTTIQDKAHSHHRAGWNIIRDVLISKQQRASVRTVHLIQRWPIAVRTLPL